MPNKPTEKPYWAEQTSTTVQGGQAPRRQEPNSTLKAQGWSYGDKPQHEYMNWWMQNLSSWARYVDGLQASDIHTQASGTVQQALDAIGVVNAGQQSSLQALASALAQLPQADSIGLRELKKPAETVVGPDAWSAITGAIAYNGSVWPGSSGTEVWGSSGAQDINWWDVQERVLDGLEIRNTTRVNNLYSNVVLRIHGDLVVRAPLQFFAAQDAQSRSINAGNPWSDLAGKRTGGAGVWGASADQSHLTYEPKPFEPLHAWLYTLRAARGIPAVQSLLPWIRGGGAAGGSGYYFRSSGGSQTTASGIRSAMGGGSALILVSGDIVFEGTGAIRCAGAPGVNVAPAMPFSWVPPLTDADVLLGAGGGGGGALAVFCGGRVRGASAGVFSAAGGAGVSLAPGTLSVAQAGNGGGGGWATLCARNASWSWVSAAAGQGGYRASGTQTNGVSGSGGEVRVMKAIPQLLF